MIEYLNKQMNEKAVGIRPYTNNGSYSPSPSYASTVSNFPSTS